MKLEISKKFGDKIVLDRFRLEVGTGEITCLLGESGCGKTTILNCIAGLLPFEGRIEGRPEEISYIFQRERLLENLTVRGNLRYVLSGRKLPDEAERIRRALEMVELTDAADSYPRTLSGGMAQRVSIARGFVYPSGLLLMDEPFRGLDFALKQRVIAQFLRIWREDGRTVIFVTHSIDEALLISDRIVLLETGGNILDDFRIDGAQEARRLSDEALGVVRRRIFRGLGI